MNLILIESSIHNAIEVQLFIFRLPFSTMQTGAEIQLLYIFHN